MVDCKRLTINKLFLEARTMTPLKQRSYESSVFGRTLKQRSYAPGLHSQNRFRLGALSPSFSEPAKTTNLLLASSERLPHRRCPPHAMAAGGQQPFLHRSMIAAWSRSRSPAGRS